MNFRKIKSRKINYFCVIFCSNEVYSTITLNKIQYFMIKRRSQPHPTPVLRWQMLCCIMSTFLSAIKIPIHLV